MNSDKKLKIAFIHPDLGIGGAERLILDIASALSLDGHQVRFISNHFDKSHAFDELKNGDFPVEVYGDWLPRSIFGKFQALCAYIRMIYLSIVYILFMRDENKPDLYFTDLIPIANPFLKLANEKVIYYCHHPDLLASAPGGELKKIYRKPIDWLEMKATGQADIILVNSQYTASVFRKTFPDIKKSIHILYPTIANSYQKTVAQLRTMKPIEKLVPEIQSNSQNKFVFLSLNRFHPAKKLELAILAMTQLKNIVSREEWDKIFLLVAGGFDPQSRINAETFLELVTLTKEKSLEDKVIFLKSPNDNLKAELLNSCSCLVYTPVKEHFGIVPLEAMLVSKPVIAVNSGGPRETVDHGVTGYLCEPNSDSLADFMYRVLKDNIKEMGARGRDRLDDRFSYSSFKMCLKKIVRKAVEEF
ncbi:alpha-1,3/1,6-mannosyltransferase Alg2 [Leptinotarsa decemlineata]|uniref:alpha-1,3/1,6-mannosyltransferase Alg2 n=1 Tax=Leptinotarsa decemlineata TaxID=7539 RepID=UPI003D30981F